MRWVPASAVPEGVVRTRARLVRYFLTPLDERLCPDLAYLFRAVSDTELFQSVAIQQIAGFHAPKPAVILQRSRRSYASSTNSRSVFAPEVISRDALRELGDCAGTVPFADKTTTRVPTFTRL